MNSNENNAPVPRILVTNDDGVHSPGLLAAVEAARRLGSVIVAAPTTQQTARGRGMTGNRDDHFHPLEMPLESAPEETLHPVEAWHIDASPALTVRHALAVLFPDRPPDLAIAGINYGENLGTNITISGTVGAAMQASAQGVPALALSRQTEIHHHYEYGELDWTDARRVTARWIGIALDRIAESGTPMPFAVLKIDIPDPCPPGTEERITRLSRQPYFRTRIENPSRTMPINRSRTYIEVDPTTLHREDDIYALALDRVVSITPLQLDCSAPVETLQSGGTQR